MLCTNCNGALLYAMSLGCGHSICARCTINIIKESMIEPDYLIPRCPICNLKVVNLTKDYNTQSLADASNCIYPAPGYEQQIEELKEDLIGTIQMHPVFMEHIEWMQTRL